MTSSYVSDLEILNLLPESTYLLN